MLMNFLKKNAPTIYYFGLILMAVALPLSKFLNGLSLFIIIGAWVVGGDYREKFRLFFADKIALLWSSVFVLHLIGLCYTTDFHYAFSDLRTKLPLLIFPFVMSSVKPLSKGQLYTLVKLFITAVVVSTFVSLAALFGIIHHVVTQSRDISFLISHIRFALLICLAIFTLLYFLKNAL